MALNIPGLTQLVWHLHWQHSTHRITSGGLLNRLKNSEHCSIVSCRSLYPLLMVLSGLNMICSAAVVKCPKQSFHSRNTRIRFAMPLYYDIDERWYAFYQR